MKHQTRALQRHYPQIYLACHTDHVRARSTPYRLSAKDSMLLAHLDEKEPISAGELARHSGVAASTMSATLQRIEAQGYIQRTPKANDRRNVELRLTPRGAEAMAATSVLDEKHVHGVLAHLTPTQRKSALAGLALLARAAQEYYRKKHPRRPLQT
jgi:DNA-binding MarR family transcriptional regulator